VARSQDGELVWVPVDAGQPTAKVESVGGTDLTTDVGILRLDEYGRGRTGLTGIDPDRGRIASQWVW